MGALIWHFSRFFMRLTVTNDLNREDSGKKGMQRDCTKRGCIGVFKLSEEENSFSEERGKLTAVTRLTLLMEARH